MTAPDHATGKHTPLHGLHVELGARMVPFAGYDMPVQYPTGIIAEHNHTRTAAGLFDVSHMGQAFLVGPDHAATAAAMEALAPADVLNLKPGRQRYTQLLNDDGGVIDDLMMTRPADAGDDGRLMLVVNASRKDVDYAWIEARLPAGVRLETAPERALLAIQGPKAEAVLGRHCDQIATLDFMAARPAVIAGADCHVSRSGYTGEDGFEISVAGDAAEDLARILLAEDEVLPIGLGARDSLRLEAGLCLYGHELDETTSPVEAGLVWSMQKRRRIDGGFPGFERIRRELTDGPSRVRVGLVVEGRAPAREGAEIRTPEGETVGIVTSGGFAPSFGGPIAMGYLPPSLAAPDTVVDLVVRGRPLTARVAKMPFVAHRYKR